MAGGKSEPHRARGRHCARGTLSPNSEAPEREVVLPELGEGPWGSLQASLKVFTPSQLGRLAGGRRGLQEGRRGDGDTQGQTPGREGPEEEQGTHHCGDPSWAWLAWRPRRPLKGDKSVGWKEAPITRPREAAGDQPQEQALNLVTAAPSCSLSLPSICSCI